MAENKPIKETNNKIDKIDKHKKRKKNPDDMSFWEHLDELRKRIFHSIIIITIGFLISFRYSEKIYIFMAKPVLKYLKGGSLAYTSLTEPFMMYMKLAFFASIFLTSPLLFYEFWKFISPALKKKEKRLAIPFILFSTAFFLIGGWFGYTIVFPAACKFFLEIGKSFTPVITINQYLSLATKVLFGVATTFELPILIFFLARLGIINAKFLIKYFKFFILLAFIIAAVITPTPDMVTQSIIALPLIGLYLVGILVALIFGKKKKTDDKQN